MPLERLAKGIPTFHPAILKTQQLAVGCSELNLNYKLRQDSNSINTHRHHDILRHLLEKVSDMKDELIKGNGSLLNVHKSSSVAILNRLICDAATQAAAAHSESLQKISSHSRHTQACLKNDHFTSP